MWTGCCWAGLGISPPLGWLLGQRFTEDVKSPWPQLPGGFHPCPQVFTSGTDEFLELCKAVYELAAELKLRCAGQPALVRSAAATAAAASAARGGLALGRRGGTFPPAAASLRSIPRLPMVVPAQRASAPSPTLLLQPWDGRQPYQRCDDDALIAWPRSVGHG